MASKISKPSNLKPKGSHNTMLPLDNLTNEDVKNIIECAKKLNVKNTEPSNRFVVVVDRGWIFAGDMSETPDGYVKLSLAIHIISWHSVGFSGMILDPNSKNVTLRPVNDVEIPEDSIIFRVPVGKNWGTKE